MTLITVFTCDDAGDADVTETGGMSQSPVLWSRLDDSLEFSRGVPNGKFLLIFVVATWGA